MNVEEEAALVVTVTRELHIDARQVYPLAHAIWATQGYTRCHLMSIRMGERCLYLPGHDGLCGFMLSSGAIQQERGQAPPRSLLRLVQFYGVGGE